MNVSGAFSGPGLGVDLGERQIERARVRQSRFHALVLPHLDDAVNLAWWLAGNRADAEDIVQEAVLRAFKYFDRFSGEKARPWLLAIVRNTVSACGVFNEVISVARRWISRF